MPPKSDSQIHLDRDQQDIDKHVMTQVQVRLAASAASPLEKSAAQLAGLLKVPKRLSFTVGFVDCVIRPENVHVATP